MCKHIPSHTTLNFYFFLWFDEDRRVTAADVRRCANIYPLSTAAQCNTLQHTATPCSTLQHTAKHCNTLQHTATHCNTLQHTTHRLDIHLIKKPTNIGLGVSINVYFAAHTWADFYKQRLMYLYEISVTCRVYKCVFHTHLKKKPSHKVFDSACPYMYILLYTHGLIKNSQYYRHSAC